MERNAGAFETCVCMWDWWDGPLFGISSGSGEARYFQHRFSEELDDYAPEFLLWPCSPADLEVELRMWELWVEWRQGFDLGERADGFTRDSEFQRLEDRVRANHEPPGDAVLAVPTWRLATERSYRSGAPRHLVAWALA